MDNPAVLIFCILLPICIIRKDFSIMYLQKKAQGGDQSKHNTKNLQNSRDSSGEAYVKDSV